MQKSLVQKVAAVTVLGALLAGALYLKGPRRDASPPAGTATKGEPTRTDPRPSEGDEADKAPRLILGHVWFDRYPEKRNDEIEIVIFFGGGIGITDKGSAYRSTLEIFEFERQKDRLDVTFLHDKRKADVKFKVESCDDRPPFDACLTFDPPFGGRKKLYGFLHDEEMDRKVPWAREWKSAAEVRTRTVK